MPRTRRFAQYIQKLAYDSLYRPDERDEWPEDASLRAMEPRPNSPSWKAVSFATYAPYREPDQG